jgi:hypothetical protein
MRLRTGGVIIKRVIVSLMVLAIYLAVSYVLAGDYLSWLRGSDTPSFINRLMLIKQNFPNHAFWNEQEGGGVTLNYEYPPLIQMVIIVLTKLTNLDVVSWVKILGFLSLSLSAYGFYWLVWLRFKVWVVALLTGLFYLVSPIAYIWLFEFGFYAELVAGVLFPWIILFFDLWLEERLKKKANSRIRIYFGGTVLLLSLSLLSHPIVFFGAWWFIAAYGLLRAIWLKKSRWLRTKKVMMGMIGMMAAAMVLVSFWFVPFIVNENLEMKGRTAITRTLEAAEYDDIDLKSVLSIDLPKKLGDKGFQFRHFSYPLALTLLLPIGLVMAGIFKQKRLLLGFAAAAAGLGLAVVPRVLVFFSKIPFMLFIANWRILSFSTRLLIPLTAAWGVYGVVYWVIFPLKLIEKQRWLRWLRQGLVAVVVLGVSGWWLWQWGNKPGEVEDRMGYGREVSKCNVWKAYAAYYCEAEPESIWHQLSDKQRWREPLGRIKQETMFGPDFEEFIKGIPGDKFTRASFSARTAAAMMVAPFLYSGTLFTSYDVLSLLMTRMYAVQQGNLFAIEDLTYVDTRVTPDLADWFGIKYVVAKLSIDPVERLGKAGFKEVNRGVGLAAYELETAEPIMAVGKKPRILVIGQDHRRQRIYDLVFRKALFNMIDYDQAMLVHGEEHVSEYDLEELEQFEMVWLYGYEYDNRTKAWGLLEEYVRKGGRLFIDTGWQFTAADWQVEKTAEFFPTKELEWTELGVEAKYQLAGDLVNIEGVELGRFRPLIWNEKSWGVSTSDNLRDWSRLVLSAEGKPLIAGGEYGEGRVIWSGMNILGHIEGFDWYNEEVKLMRRVVDWLLKGYGRDKKELGEDYVVRRPSSDEVEFEMRTYMPEGYGLYFKEAYHPYWRAKLVADDGVKALKIYKAGPDLKYVFLPEVKEGNKVILYVQRPWWYRVLPLISIAGLIGLLLMMFKPGLIQMRWLKRWQLKWKNRMRKVWEDEEG